MVEALGCVDGDPTPAKPLGAIDAVQSDFGGVVLSYGPDKNQGSGWVFFTIMQADGSSKPVVRPVKTVGQ